MVVSENFLSLRNLFPPSFFSFLPSSCPFFFNLGFTQKSGRPCLSITHIEEESTKELLSSSADLGEFIWRFILG